MATTYSRNTGWDYNGIQFDKSVDKMTDAEWNNAFSRIRTTQSRLNQLSPGGVSGAAAGSTSGISTNNTYANNGSSSNTQTSSNFGGDWTQGNNNFGFDSMMKQAKDLASFHLENAGKQMELSYGYRDREANRDSNLRMKESDQGYQQQRGLGEQQYGFQRGLNDQRNSFDVARIQLQESFRQNQVDDNRAAAHRLYFGRARGGRRF
jgi:hypothetical protein